MKSSDLKSIKILLLLIALPISFYVLKLLSFIFIPLLFSMIVALMFLPLMRKLNKKNIPKSISLIIVILIIGIFIFLTNQVVQFSGRELMSTENNFIIDIEEKLKETLIFIEQKVGIERINGESISEHYIQKLNIEDKLNSIMDYIGSIFSMSLTTIFFTILLLTESLNFQKILNSTIIKQKRESVKVFMKIEKDIITFVKVKFWVSLFTGIGFSVACYFFDVSFPIFWGLVAFLLNFIQMIGSIVSIIILSLFAFIEIDSINVLLFFVLSITGVQVIFGSITEPILMGKSFSINVITILIMLMFWGFIWGIPGMILSVPLTVFIKIILDQFPKTKVIASLMSES